MILTEKDLDRLKQLDRIEFRQKYERLEKIGGGSCTLTFLYSMISVTAFLFLLMVAGYGSFGMGFAERIGIVLILVYKLAMLGLIVCIILDIFFFYVFFKARRNLVSEYFIIKKEALIPRRKR